MESTCSEFWHVHIHLAHPVMGRRIWCDALGWLFFSQFLCGWWELLWEFYSFSFVSNFFSFLEACKNVLLSWEFRNFSKLCLNVYVCSSITSGTWWALLDCKFRCSFIAGKCSSNLFNYCLFSICSFSSSGTPIICWGGIFEVLSKSLTSSLSLIFALCFEITLQFYLPDH